MIHLGQNIAKIRGIKRLPQKEMAAKLELSQPEYSRIEQKAQIDDDLLERIANVLEISPEFIRGFREESIFTNNIYEQNNTISQVYFQTNPLDKIIELYETILKEKNEMLKQKDEVIEMYKQQQKAS